MRIIKCEDCVNFRDGQCVEYGKERDLALKDCLHNGGFLHIDQEKRADVE